MYNSIVTYLKLILDLDLKRKQVRGQLDRNDKLAMGAKRVFNLYVNKSDRDAVIG